MTFYRFYSPAKTQWAVSSIEGNYLYCANWRDLNDPMEGYFELEEGVERSAVIDLLNKIRRDKGLFRTCSLTKRLHSPQMWAYYADNYSGFAIEVNVNLSDAREITYHNDSFRPSMQTSAAQHQQVAEQILLHKHMDWQHEAEFRILSYGERYSLADGAIRRVIVGSKIPPSSLEALRAACIGRDIQMARLSVRPSGFTTVAI